MAFIEYTVSILVLTAALILFWPGAAHQSKDFLESGHKIECRKGSPVKISDYIPVFGSTVSLCYKCDCPHGFVACHRTTNNTSACDLSKDPKKLGRKKPDAPNLKGSVNKVGSGPKHNSATHSLEPTASSSSTQQRPESTISKTRKTATKATKPAGVNQANEDHLRVASEVLGEDFIRRRLMLIEKLRGPGRKADRGNSPSAASEQSVTTSAATTTTTTANVLMGKLSSCNLDEQCPLESASTLTIGALDENLETFNLTRWNAISSTQLMAKPLVIISQSQD